MVILLLQVKKYEEDPLVWHGGMKAKIATCFLNTFEYFKSKMADIHIPHLTVHGTEDKLTAPHLTFLRLWSGKVWVFSPR